MRRWKERLWPKIDDPPSARRAVDRAVRLTALWSLIYLALGLTMIFSGARMTERSPVEWQGTGLDGAGISISGIAFVYFVNAVRAAFAYERLMADQPISGILAEHPVTE
jgi:hypothetical protein